MKEACKREGIRREDLFTRTRETVIHMIKEKDVTGAMLREDIIQTVFDHLEEKRRRKIIIVHQ